MFHHISPLFCSCILWEFDCMSYHPKYTILEPASYSFPILLLFLLMMSSLSHVLPLKESVWLCLWVYIMTLGRCLSIFSPSFECVYTARVPWWCVFTCHEKIKINGAWWLMWAFLLVFLSVIHLQVCFWFHRLGKNYSKHAKFLRHMRTKHDDCVPPIVIYGHQFTMASHYQDAVREYLAAYKLLPENPLVNLCVGKIFSFSFILFWTLNLCAYNCIKSFGNGISSRNSIYQFSPWIQTSKQASMCCTRLIIPL